MTTYNNPFTGQTIQPSSVGFESLTISANTSLSWSINGLGGDVPTAASIINVSATTTGLALLMPPAYQVSTGQDILINNIGSNPVAIKTNSGTTTICNIASGAVEYIYLTNNSTTDGTWNAFTFGTGTSAANAGTLAGYGLNAIGNTLNQTYPVTSYFTNATLSANSQAAFAIWSGGVGTITLPSSATVGANWFVNIGNYGTGILTLTPVGTDTINGNVNQQLQLTESLVLVSTGTGWNTFGYGRSNQFAYTQFALAVTGGTLTLTSAQASNTIQEYSGALASNQIIVVPSTVQLYSFVNNTTGAYTLIVKTSVSGGATVSVPQGGTLILVCDGTNVYNAASGTASSFTTITLGNGSLAIPSLKFVGDANTGLYLPSTSTLGVVVNNTLIGSFTTAGLSIVGTVTASGGISGGTF
jgi:hypothetical protein